MSYELAKAYIQVVPTTKGIKGELENEMGSAGESAGGKFGSGFSSALGTAGKIAAAALGVATAAIIGGTKALIDGVVAVAEYGDNIDKMSQKMGMSAEKYQEWDFIMQHCGSSIESMKAPMKTLATAAQTGSEAFTKLGISQEEVANMSQEDLFAATITALQNVEDTTERTYLAGQLLGRGATELGPLLNMTAEETEAMAQQVHDLGGVMSDTAVKDAARFQDSLQDAQYAVTGLKNRMLSELLPGFADVLDGFAELVSGSEDGTKKIKQGVSNTMQSLNTMLPQAVDLISSILEGIIEAIPECAQTIVSMLPGLFDNVISMMTSLIPGILKILPELINSAMQLIASLVGHLSEIITPIIKAIPTIIKSFVSGLIANLPELISGIIDLVVSIASELPSICNEIVEYIPQLFVQLAAAIVQCIPKILMAVGELVNNIILSLFGLEDPIKAVNEKMTSIGETAQKSWTELQDVMSTPVDMSWVEGTFSKTQSEIDSAESMIREILRTRFQEQEDLRQEDIQNIKDYQTQLEELENQKLSMYDQKAAGRLAIMENMENATLEDYMKQLGMLQQYDAAERAELEEYYASKMGLAQQTQEQMLADALRAYEEEGTITYEEYQKRIQEAQDAYDQLAGQTQAYYDEHIAEINSREQEAMNIIADSNNGFVQDLNTTYSEASDANKKWLDSVKEGSEAYGFEMLAARQISQDASKDLINSMSQADVQNTVAWLNMVAAVKAGGGTISGDMKSTTQNILGAFDGMPADMQGAGKDMLEGLAIGMKDYIPELQDTSDMTAEEILNTIKSYLGIASPSREMMTVGQYTVQGLVKGIQNSSNSAQSAMQSVGSNLIQGVGWGIQNKSGWLYNVAYNTVAQAVSAAKAAGDIHSPSRIMRDEVGLMLSEGLALGIEDGEDEVLSVVDSMGKEINDSMREFSLSSDIMEETMHLGSSAGSLAMMENATGQMMQSVASQAAAEGNKENEVQLQMLRVLMTYLPQMLKVMSEKTGMTAEEIAAMLAQPMSKELGRLERMNGRGVCMA